MAGHPLPLTASADVALAGLGKLSAPGSCPRLLAEAVEALIEAKPLPELPGVGGNPVSGPYDVRGRHREFDTPPERSRALPGDAAAAEGAGE